MAILMPRSMGALNEEHKPVYPLFQKASKSQPPPPSIDQTTSLTPAADDTDILAALKKTSTKGNKKARKSVKVEKPGKEDTLKDATKQPSTNGAELLEVDPNNGRKKRRKTTPPDARFSSDENQEPAQGKRPQDLDPGQTSDAGYPPFFPPEVASAAAATQEQGKLASELDEAIQTRFSPIPIPPVSNVQEEVTTSQNDPTTFTIPPSLHSDEPADINGINIPSKDTQVTSSDAAETKPKKILRLNPKTGTFGSPPPKKLVLQSVESVPKVRSSGRVKKTTSRIVILTYGEGHSSSQELGGRIEAILNGTRTAVSFIEKIVEIPKVPKATKIIGSGPVAAPHPFFMPKAASKPANSQKAVESVPEVIEVPPPKDPSTLGRTRAIPSTGMPSPSKPKPIASAFAGFGSNSGMLKFPGAIEPAWPWKDMVHIRGTHEEVINVDFSSELQAKAKKSKYQSTQVLGDEDILGILAGELCIGQVIRDIGDINPDEYPPLPACLRIPTKHFEAGPGIQKRVRKELKSRIPMTVEPQDSSEDEIQDGTTNRPRLHPALTKAYASINTSLSAFDKAQCETHAWTHKYAPTSAVEVLQTGREALILKEWLQNLTVMAVESGASASKPSASMKPDSGKRKRKSKKIDGFVISSDEEEGDMDEISEPEDSSPPSGSQSLLKKTVIRTGNGAKDSARLSNGVVISGPHGCGKSATVYAVAKELGFEVFEINSSSRRSGKDILEKVGDMTRNHLVQHAHTQVPAEPVDEDAQRISDALDDDLKSGRQGTMNSFFKTKESNAKPKPKKSAPAAKKVDAGKQPAVFKAPPKKQKQSLILFEEVDVLYEEDKQFWATVMSLIVQSKRPVIMTCTDESAVPLQSLSLYGILRFTSPPIDLATDYMLLVAACEGHILRREAVESLYESRQLDLRASLTEINFWCQFSVGSLKGGLDWFYDRWPPGKDVDENGKTIRVVSEGTYEPGMGWLSQDSLESHANYLNIEEETLHGAWDGWNLDVGHWQENIDLIGWATKLQALSTRGKHGLAVLEMYDDFAESMSAADLSSTGSFSLHNQVLMDTCQPELSSKARDDYTLAHELIEVNPIINYSNLGKDISIWMKSRSRNYLQVAQHSKLDLEILTELDRPSEKRVISLIRDQCTSPESSLIRRDFSLAFDPISDPEKGSLYGAGSLEASMFDRTISLIAVDIAAYVRSIVSYDARLQQDRARLSGLLSEGGRRGKRMRTTRAAMSALEGGARSTTRKDRYFGPGLNPYFVLKTGKQSWLDALDKEIGAITIGTMSGSRRSSTGEVDVSRVGNGNNEEDELDDE